jgi:hypothetical protein
MKQSPNVKVKHIEMKTTNTVLKTREVSKGTYVVSYGTRYYSYVLLSIRQNRNEKNKIAHILEACNQVFLVN